MLTFKQFLEYAVSDLRYFKALPDTEPDKDVLACENRYHLAGSIHWKQIHNRTFSTSREMDDGIIAMVPGDIEENFYHELGHEVWDHCDKEKIKPVLDQVREKFQQVDDPKDKLKYINLDGWLYSYNHSGPEFVYDELFAISFAFYEGDHKHFDDPPIDKQFTAVLSDLRKQPLFNKDPYKSSKLA